MLTVNLSEDLITYIIDSLDPDDPRSAAVFRALINVKDAPRPDSEVKNFAPGDRVILSGNLRPKYLLGLKGEALTRPTQTAHRRVKVLIDEGVRGRGERYVHPDGTISVPASCLTHDKGN